VSVSKDEVLAARTIHIIPTAYSAVTGEQSFPEANLRLIANAIDRSLCTGLSDRFQIMSDAEPADLTVHAFITRVIPTDPTAAAASKVTEAAAQAASIVHGITVPSLRIPIGLGGLALEAEAVDRIGGQKAAIMWARGADSLTTKARVSPIGDAYELASSFGDDFSKLLVTGASPFKTLPSLPTVERISAMLGGAPKESACEAFGRAPGVPGFIGRAIGVPPEWTDRGTPPDGQTMR
jgi:hypothetical protein